MRFLAIVSVFVAVVQVAFAAPVLRGLPLAQLQERGGTPDGPSEVLDSDGKQTTNIRSGRASTNEKNHSLPPKLSIDIPKAGAGNEAPENTASPDLSPLTFSERRPAGDDAIRGEDDTPVGNRAAAGLLPLPGKNLGAHQKKGDAHQVKGDAHQVKGDAHQEKEDAH